jgi:hypothetical protein
MTQPAAAPQDGGGHDHAEADISTEKSYPARLERSVACDAPGEQLWS